MRIIFSQRSHHLAPDLSVPERLARRRVELETSRLEDLVSQARRAVAKCRS